MKEEVGSHIIKKRYIKELKSLFSENNITVDEVVGWFAEISIKKGIHDEIAHITIDNKTIEVRDKEVYKALKSFGEKHNFETLIKCWDELVDEYE